MTDAARAHAAQARPGRAPRPARVDGGTTRRTFAGRQPARRRTAPKWARGPRSARGPPSPEGRGRPRSHPRDTRSNPRTARDIRRPALRSRPAAVVSIGRAPAPRRRDRRRIWLEDDHPPDTSLLRPVSPEVGRYDAGRSRQLGTAARSRTPPWCTARRARAGMLLASAIATSRARSQRRRPTAAAKISPGQGSSPPLRYLQARM